MESIFYAVELRGTLISEVYGRKVEEAPGANTAAGGEPHPPSHLQLLPQGVQETQRSVASHAHAHKGTFSCLVFLAVLEMKVTER